MNPLTKGFIDLSKNEIGKKSNNGWNNRCPADPIKQI